MLRNRYSAVLFTLLAALVYLGPAAEAADKSALRPPKGYRLAVVEFADLQCPDCARAEPVIQEAIKAYKIPLVRYDFPLPNHNWAFEAHVLARYFDSKSKQLGEGFRQYVYQNQRALTPQNLRQYADRFASENKAALPLFVDPRGELAAKVRADYSLGQRLGVQHTPTIYIVTDSAKGTPFVEVVDRSKFFAMLDDMKRQVGGSVTVSKKK